MPVILRIRTIPQPKKSKLHPIQERLGEFLQQQGFPELPRIPRQVTLAGRRDDEDDKCIRCK